MCVDKAWSELSNYNGLCELKINIFSFFIFCVFSAKIPAEYYRPRNSKSLKCSANALARGTAGKKTLSPHCYLTKCWSALL